METQLVAEFVSKTRASPNDALSCLRTWGWDLKKALIDYNGNFTDINFVSATDFHVFKLIVEFKGYIRTTPFRTLDFCWKIEEFPN